VTAITVTPLRADYPYEEVRHIFTMQAVTDSYHAGRSQILIVENDEPVLHSLEALVQSEGFDVRTTWSGREALALIQSQPFDLVLVDSHLPDIYYGEFLRLASRHSRSIIVMQRGRPLPGSLRRHKTLGAAAVVDKGDPRQLRQLLAARHAKLAHAQGS
jgi:two-component system, OmpR family, response regulator TctD